MPKALGAQLDNFMSLIGYAATLGSGAMPDHRENCPRLRGAVLIVASESSVGSSQNRLV
jgi:hypothetical protein